MLNLKNIFAKYIKAGEVLGKFVSATAGIISFILLIVSIVNVNALSYKVQMLVIDNFYKEENQIKSLKVGVNYLLFEKILESQPDLILNNKSKDGKREYVEQVYNKINCIVQMVRYKDSNSVLFFTITAKNDKFKPSHLYENIQFNKLTFEQSVNELYYNKGDGRVPKAYDPKLLETDHIWWNSDISARTVGRYMEIITVRPILYEQTVILGTYTSGAIRTNDIKRNTPNEKELSDYRKQNKYNIFGLADYQSEINFADFIDGEMVAQIGLSANILNKLQYSQF